MSYLENSLDEDKYTSAEKFSSPRSRGSTESQFRKMQHCYSTSSEWGDSTERGSIDEDISDHTVATIRRASVFQSRSKRRSKQLSSASSGDSGIFAGVSKKSWEFSLLDQMGLEKQR